MAIQSASPRGGKRLLLRAKFRPRRGAPAHASTKAEQAVFLAPCLAGRGGSAKNGVWQERVDGSG